MKSVCFIGTAQQCTIFVYSPEFAICVVGTAHQISIILG